jgi:hypothetical protein
MAYFGSDEHGRWNPNLAKAQFDTHVKNVIAKYNEASPEMLKGGSDWYEKAHDIASKLTPGDTKRGAGIIAALSPLTSWEKNISKAHELIKTGTTAHLSPDAVIKAQRIHAGEDPEDVLGGHKVRSFFGNIHDPSNPEPVTIDRHAYDIAMGRQFAGQGGKPKRNITVGPSGHKPMSEDLGLAAKGRYNYYNSVYKGASNELGISIPNKVQATSWVTHRGAIG